jgi:hypothetical protein
MRKILLLFISTIVIVTSCRKADQFINENNLSEKQIIEQFISVPTYLNPSLQKIANYLHEKDKQRPFITNISSKVGLPLWDKAQFKKTKTHSAAARTNSNGDSTVLIPLSLPNSYEVSGFITATLDENNNVVSASEYDKFNYQLLGYNNSISIADAEDVVIQCLVLQKEIFGVTTFKLLDNRLFDTDNDSSNFRRNYEISLSEINQSSAERVRIVVVKSNHCTHHDGDGPNGNDGDQDCDQCDWCGKFTYDYYVIAYDSPFDTGGGGSGGIGGQFGGGIGGWSSTGTTVLNAANFVSSVSSLDVAAINDITASDNFKIAYAQLEEIYKARPIGLYSSMSRGDFIQMLQQNPSLAKYIDPVTLLVKLGANAAADVLMQVMVLRLTDPNVNSWGDAIDKIDWIQVGASAISGLFSWNNPSSKFIVAGINGAAAVISDLSQNGFQSWEQSGLKFLQGFGASLIGNAAGDFIISKFGSIKSFGSSLVTKMGSHFQYNTICKWLGGGLSNVVETLSTSHGVISSVKTMVGFSPANQVCVIGRNMANRVKPFAQTKNAVYFDKSCPLALPYITPQVEADLATRVAANGGNPLSFKQAQESLMYKANEKFIADLKDQGYTFIDLGDAGFAPNSSAFYFMEISSIFN